MRFGISLGTEGDPDETLRLVRLAEELGFSFAWLYEMPGPGMDPYPLLGAAATLTKRLRLGLGVTNPSVRPWDQTALLTATIHCISKGRMELGIGRGDLSVRLLGRKPSSLEDLAGCVRLTREAAEGGVLRLSQPVALPWACHLPLRVWIGTYGPQGLHLAGRMGDGVVLQFADPDLVRWAAGFIDDGAREATRTPGDVARMVGCPASLAQGPDEVRWFARLIGQDVTRLVLGASEATMPEWWRERAARLDPGRSGGAAAVERRSALDEVAMRLALVGPPAEHVRRLRELEACGVESFNLFLEPGQGFKRYRALLEVYASEVMAPLAESPKPHQPSAPTASAPS